MWMTCWSVLSVWGYIGNTAKRKICCNCQLPNARKKYYYCYYYFYLFQILLDILSDSRSLSLWNNHALACSIRFALPHTWRYSSYLDTFANAHIFYSDMHQLMRPCASYWLQCTAATSLCCYCFWVKFTKIVCSRQHQLVPLMVSNLLLYTKEM